MPSGNPLISDRTAEFLLFEVLDAESLCALPYFAEHSRPTFELYLQACAKLAREVVYPTYKPMDEYASPFRDGRVLTHPVMAELYPKLVELGVLTAARSAEVDGQQLPLTVSSLAAAYVMAANAAAFGYCMLTSGSAHLIEAFGSEELKARFMRPMYAGQFAGTMALTEPGAGSSLGDLRVRARRTDSAYYLMSGEKVFISGGDQQVTENIVNLVLARIDGAPEGVKGISLFAVPRLREQDGAWVSNDVHAAGAFHKMGWRGLPSIALSLGENGDCHGYLVGEPNQGLSYMFQMMNEARIQIGLHGVATASVAYHEALAYARTRVQGRPPGRPSSAAPVEIIAHADVRRMLLRQKAIVEGGLALVLATARYQDLAEHAAGAEQRARAQALLDLLTPMAKTFPAERGFEANTLAIQVHGGYGYTSEYLPEAWLRDQKLNSIHEGTTGIQSQDLLGRKLLRDGGQAFALLASEIAAACESARAEGLAPLAAELEQAIALAARVIEALIARRDDARAALRHSADFLDMLATICVAWQWLAMATTAQRGLSSSARARASDAPFYRGKLRAAQYFVRTELPRVQLLAELCASGEDSYDLIDPEEF